MKVTSALMGLASLFFAASSLAATAGEEAAGAEDKAAETKEAPAAPKHDRKAIEIPLGDDEKAELRLSFNYRARAEYRRPASYGPGPLNDDSDSAVLSRLRIGANLQLPGDVGMQLTVQDARSFGNEPRGAVNTGTNGLSFFEAYFEFKNLMDKGVNATFGRQQIEYGTGRVLGLPEFSNTGRSMDGIKLERKGESYKTSAFAFLVSEGARSDTHEYLFGATFSPSGSDAFTWELLGMFELRQDPVGNQDAAAKATWNPRAFGMIGEDVKFDDEKKRKTWGWEAEFAIQHGEETEEERSVMATAFAIRLEHNMILENKSLLRLEAGYDFASGDSNPADMKNRTFRAPFTSGHTWMGHADIIGYSNIHDYWAGLQYRDSEGKFSAYVALHHFRRANSGDGIYSPTGVQLRGGGGNFSREVGTELNLAVQYNFNKWVSGELAYNYFAAGNYIRQTNSGLVSDGSSYVGAANVFWASLTLKF